MKDKIVVIGSLNYDIILKLSRMPKCGETFHADGVTCSAGGKGANQAVQAAKLGCQVYMVGAVGKDSNGAFLLETARKYGVDTRYVAQVEEATGMGVVQAVQDGSVFASIVRGANFAVTKEHIDAAEPVLREAALVILQMEIPQQINEYAIDKARALGCKVLMNAAPAAPIPEEYLKKLDILVVNEVEAGFYLNETVDTAEKGSDGARRLSERYGCDVVLTMGKAGAAICDGGTVSFVPAKKVNAIETTGAGDSFIGAIGYALLQGKTLTEASAFATACSAITVCRMGAQPSMPTLAEVQQS